jgi:hypothetical protein
MNGYEAAVVMMLLATPDLVTLVTGGIYADSALEKDAISLTSLPAAYESNGTMKVTTVVKGLAVIGRNDIRDADAKYAATNQTIQCWIYDDPDSTWTAVNTAVGLVYSALNEERVSGGFKLKWEQDVFDRDPDMQNALFARCSFLVVGKKSA